MVPIKINPSFENCINNIKGGKKTLESLDIIDNYKPNIKFKREGDFFYSIPQIVPQNYIAAFDLDWTLTANENKLFPTAADPEDIVLLPDRYTKLIELLKKGYTLALFTNQKTKGKGQEKSIKRVTYFLEQLGLPCYAFIATGDDKYRKPGVGMWGKLQQLIPTISYAFFVGDALGRPQDFSDSDLKFAENIGIPCYSPEEFFPCQKINLDINKVMVLTVGAPGAGKSSFIQHNLVPLGYTIISRDLIGSKTKFIKAVQKAVISSTRVAVDSTNGKQTDRELMYEIALAAGMKIIVVYLLRNGYGYNLLRSKPVPAIAYHCYYKNMNPPTLKNTPGEVFTVTNPFCTS